MTNLETVSRQYQKKKRSLKIEKYSNYTALLTKLKSPIKRQISIL